MRILPFSYIKVFSFKKENGSTIVDMDYPVYTEIKPQAFDIYLRNFALISSGKGKFCVKYAQEIAYEKFTLIQVQLYATQLVILFYRSTFLCNWRLQPLLCIHRNCRVYALSN